MKGKELKKISVIITVYNVEKFLEKCISSVLHQTYANLEIILVDDCSSDKSGKICDRFAQMDNRVKVIHLKEDLGYNIGFLTGVKNATGDWIIFMDSDDWLDSNDAYEKVLKKIDNDADHILLDNYICEGNKKKINKHFSDEFIAKKYEDKIGILCTIYSPQYSPVKNYVREGEVWNRLYRADLINKCMDDFNEYLPQIPSRYTCVLGALLGFIHANTIQYIQESIYCFRIHTNSSSLSYHKNVRKTWENGNRIIRKIAEKYELGERFYLSMNRVFITSIFQYACQYAFHNQNKMSYNEKRKDFNNFINTEPYCSALKYIDYKELPNTVKKMFYKGKICVTKVYFLVKLRELVHIIRLPRYLLERKFTKSDWD